MEVDPESPPFYGFESDTADTSTSEIFEDPSAPPEDEATVEGEKSEPTPTQASRAAEDPQPSSSSRENRGAREESAPTPRILRPRGNTVGGTSSSELAVLAAKNRISVKKRGPKKKPAASGPPNSLPSSTESLSWDNSAQRFLQPDSGSRLWSTSTQFSVPAASPDSIMSDPEGIQSLDNVANSSANTVVESNVQGLETNRSNNTEQPKQASPPPVESLVVPTLRISDLGLRSRPNSPSQWPNIARAAIVKAQDCIYPYRDPRTYLASTTELRAKAGRILDVLHAAHPYCDEDTQADIKNCRASIAVIIANLEARSAVGVNIHHHPPPTGNRDKQVPGVRPLVTTLSAPATTPFGGSSAVDRPDPPHDQRGQAKNSNLNPSHQQGEGEHFTSSESWSQIASRAITRAEVHIYPYEGKRVRSSTLVELRAKANQILDYLLDTHPHCDSDTQAKITACTARVARINADLEDQSFDLSEDLQRSNLSGSPAATSSPTRPPPPPRSRSPPPTALANARSTLKYLLELISDDQLHDVEPGSPVDDEMLKYLHDVSVREIKGTIKECRDAIGKYAAFHGADQVLIAKAHLQFRRAHEWTQQVITRFRSSQLHLEGNLPAKEVSFKQFDPNGETSVYEFLTLYEEWARGYISDAAKARLLFSKYLSSKLTEGYEELKRRKHDYGSMKNWLIDNFGSVKKVADMQLKAIKSLKAPKSDSDHSSQAQYLRNIHRHLTTLYNLEIRKGVKVPQLQEFISSHTFVMQIGEILPPEVRKDWTDSLADDGVITHKVEGLAHFDKILTILKKRYMARELQANLSTTELPPKPKAKTHHAGELDDSDSDDESSPPAKQSKKKTHTAKTSSSPKQPKKPDKKDRQGVQSKPPAKLPRWTCPIKDHEKHNIKECNEFFMSHPKKRRSLCRWQACWTCLSRDSKCRTGECSRIKEIPTILICQDCLVSPRGGTKSMNILFCGLEDHIKPDLEDVKAALEKWIPGFQASKLTSPLTVTFATTHTAKSSKPPKSRSSPPSSSPPMLAFDTCTGEVAEITRKDNIVRQSKEDSFYVMQQLCISGETVLAFYDSGSNAHLIEGELAESAGFPVLDDRCVRIGVVGGGDIWSEYGSYSCYLGPDANRRYHEIECQGLARITSTFPEFDLTPIAKEAACVMGRGRDIQYPTFLGGERVKLLIGVKSTRLAPVLQHCLPGGLGIYQSALPDVHGSTVCYGGPHEVFTRGYAKAGMNANHLQVLFTESAISYMRAPYTFVGARTEDHGPKPMTTSTTLPDDVFPDSYEDWCKDRDAIPPSRTNSSACYCNELTHSATSGKCYKAAVPLSKLKGLMDEDDIQAGTDYRCDACANCPKCRMSARAKTRSHQEEYEQEVIEKSVTIDFKEKKVFVDLPFIKSPVEFLSTKHRRDDNLPQALRIYQSQCKKPEEIKQQVRAAHKDLLGRGFMVPLSSLPLEQRKLIRSAPFRHYFPWRAVYKPGSVSTPVRIVVDPSCTGLNIILAKGRNMLPMIPEILIRLRTQRCAWSSDISKLYNRLYLNESSLPYSLFLYNESLSDDDKPDTWVLTRAWYGVSSTGNQAGVSLERLAEANKDVYPLAVNPMTRDKYVDDMVSGGDSPEEREEQIQQTTASLETAGFTMKYVARSGENPPAEATIDGITVGCLGLAWDTKRDSLGPALQSMNLKKKVRGQKAAPDRDLSNPDGIRRAFKDGLISRAGVLSRVAEFFDPAGWWEPLRLQAKLSLQDLNPLDWSDRVPDDLHEDWVNHFMSFEHARGFAIPRCIIPNSADPSWKLRLICLADAAEGAGGTAIYGGVKLPDGSYTCDLLMAKSRLMSHTVPRNELEAILLMADTALAVRNSLGDRVESVFFYTDSTVAMAWILNTRKRLRMFVYNRSQSARQAMRQVTDGAETIPLYHIDGTLNVADMVTKPRTITPKDTATGSPWMNGLPWMRLATEDLPTQQYVLPPEPDLERQMIIETFQDIDAHLGQVESRQQLMQEMDTVDATSCAVFSARAKGGGETQDWLSENFDFVHLGWERAKNRLKLVCRALFMICHRRHMPNAQPVPACPVCTETLEADITRITADVISRYASRQVTKVAGKQRLLRNCTKKDGIWYSTQRLSKEGLLDTADLDFSPFYDEVSIKKVLPIILVQSPLFHAFALHTHFVELPHAGVEATLARIKQTFFPIGDARRALSTIKRACSKCRLMAKRAVGLELADIHDARTTIAPPFYSCMMDIAMGFKARPTKDSRKSIVVHAIVIVCLLTSATSIHVIEGLTTQSVIMALERHSSRYGVPAHIYVDSGTQLEKLRDTSFSLRDVQSWDSQGVSFSITVSTPKAHEQQGRVEAKIKIVRKMLQKFSDTCELVNTLIGWETVFARIADHIDNVPISRGSASAPSDLGWEVITPNRLKLGRNNFRQLEGNIVLTGAPQTMLERNRLLSEKWYEIFIQRIHLFVPQSRKAPTQQLQAGDVVLFTFQDAGTPRMWIWKLGIITRQKSRSTFEIRYVNNAGAQPRLISRDLRHICLIHGADEIPPMSSRFTSQPQ